MGVVVSSALAYRHGLSIDEKAMCFVSVATFHTFCLPFLLCSVSLESLLSTSLVVLRFWGRFSDDSILFLL